MTRRLALTVLVPVALLAVAGAPAAGAAAPAAALAAAPAAQGSGYLRLAHLSPDTPHVDVYVASVSTPSRSFTAKGVGYGALSPYQAVQPDTYTISMRAAGAAPDSPPVLTTSLTVRPGGAYTVAGLGKYAELALRVLDDDLTMPPAGQSRVRVVQASTKAPALDVSVKGGVAVASGVGFAQVTGYNTVAAGGWTLLAGPPGQQATELPVTLEATGVYTVLLVDKNGGLAAELHTDAIGAGPVVPSGGVETGLGGTAGSGTALTLVGFGMAAAAAAALVGAAVRRRAAAPARHAA